MNNLLQRTLVRGDILSEKEEELVIKKNKSKDILKVEIPNEEKLSFFTKFFDQIQDKTLKERAEFVLFPKE